MFGKQRNGVDIECKLQNDIFAPLTKEDRLVQRIDTPRPGRFHLILTLRGGAVGKI